MTNFRMTRRNFNGRISGLCTALAAGAAVSSGCGMPFIGKKRHTPVGLQLYTLRDLMSKDFAGTVTKVAEIGYDAVEFAGYGGMSSSEVKKLLDDLGIVCAGTHEGYAGLSGGNLDSTIEFNASIGNGFIVCPSMPGEFRKKGADGFKAFGEKMNGIGKKVNAAGMRLCYHNHSFEFGEAGDGHLIDYLLEATDPDLVGLEVDVYWVKHGGVDPAAFIRSHADRCDMLHMKDMADDENKSFAPVGTGTLDMTGIIQAGRAVGADWYVVEQDRTKLPPLEAVEISLKNMRSLLDT